MKKPVHALLITLLLFSLTASAESPIQSLGYVLQADKLGKSKKSAVEQLATCERDLIVIDASYEIDTEDRVEVRWTKSDLDTIRAGKPGRKVVSYLSIGEAEAYRLYWKNSWDTNEDGVPEADAPKFLLGENPDWEGNYKVRFWSPEWQEIIRTEIRQIVAQGFDGVYLDIIDAFEFFEHDRESDKWIDNRINPETSRSYRDDMVNWVSIVRQTLNEDGNARLLIPQNGEALVESEGYLKIVDAIAVEDVFLKGKKLQKRSEINYRTALLRQAVEANKPVYVIEYPKSEEIKTAAIDHAKATGFSLLLTDRQLKTLGESGNP